MTVVAVNKSAVAQIYELNRLLFDTFVIDQGSKVGLCTHLFNKATCGISIFLKNME